VIDPGRLRGLEERLEPWNIEATPGVRILGYGEISAVLAIDGDDTVAYKRLPLFATTDAARAYVRVYERYTGDLREAGLDLPEDATAVVELPSRPVVLYVAQRRLPAAWFGDALVRGADAAGGRALVSAIVERVRRVRAFNERHRPHVELAIDAQVSNWVQPPDGRLLFVDTSTPLLRLGGREQLDPELLLASAPRPLRWLLRLAFLSEVMDRYYRPRQVLLDLVANLHKERRADLVPVALAVVNAALDGEAPLTTREVRRYYAADRRIWSVFLALRRLDRWTKTRLAGGRYEFVLPGPIAR
jgi:hypothetical protein